MRELIKTILIRLNLLDSVKALIDLPIRLRLLNWFVQRFIYRTRGLNFCPHFTSRVAQGKNLRIGRGVSFYLSNSGGCYIQAVNGVEIGDDTIIAAGVTIVSANHDLNDFSTHVPDKPIRIGKRCWLGAHCVILPGVQLGDDVIVGAGAVVTRSFSSGSVIAGVPAKIVKSTRRESEERRQCAFEPEA
jgi:acetyltransferase-like isoleucine patch superfamily enzyme